jgi:hypothetical protein
MRTVISSLLFLFCLTLNAQYEYDAQKVSKTTANVVDSFEVSAFRQYYCMIGFQFTFEEEPFGFEKYFSEMPKRDLLYLGLHPNPYLRVYAFHFLLENQQLNLDEALATVNQNLNDTSKINTGTWCLSDSAYTYDVYLDRMFQTFQDAAKKGIQDLILKQRPQLPSSYRDGLLIELAPDPQYYSYIRSIAKDQNNYSALVALTKYKKEDDIDLILNFTHFPEDEYSSRDCFRARLFSHFYHPKFMPILDLIINDFPQHEKILFCEYLLEAIMLCPKKDCLSRFAKIYYKLKSNTQNNYRESHLASFWNGLKGSKDRDLLALTRGTMR